MPRASSFEGSAGQITVALNPEWETLATPEEIEHAAMHEAAHLRLHEREVRNSNRRTPARRMRLELEAERCVRLMLAAPDGATVQCETL
jgi:hypothetical protein